MNIYVDSACPSNFNFDDAQKTCGCASGFYRKLIMECTGQFCFECLVCPDFCKKCDSFENCLECEGGLILKNGKCSPYENKGNRVNKALCDIFYFFFEF